MGVHDRTYPDNKIVITKCRHGGVAAGRLLLPACGEKGGMRGRLWVIGVVRAAIVRSVVRGLPLTLTLSP